MQYANLNLVTLHFLGSIYSTKIKSVTIFFSELFKYFQQGIASNAMIRLIYFSVKVYIIKKALAHLRMIKSIDYFGVGNSIPYE